MLDHFQEFTGLSQRWPVGCSVLQLPGFWSISGKPTSHCPGTEGCWPCAGPTEAQEYLLEPPCSLNSPTVDATRAGRPAQPPPSPDLMEVRCGQEEISYIAHSPWTPCLHVGPLSPLCDRVLIEHHAQITDEGIKLRSTDVTCGGTRCSWT